jgi:hypothetical protein
MSEARRILDTRLAKGDIGPNEHAKIAAQLAKTGGGEAEPRRLADIRLASGEISLGEHLSILAQIGRPNIGSGPEPSERSATSVTDGKPANTVSGSAGAAGSQFDFGKWFGENWWWVSFIAAALVLVWNNGVHRENLRNQLYYTFSRTSFSDREALCVANYVIAKDGPIFIGKSYSDENASDWKDLAREAANRCYGI